LLNPNKQTLKVVAEANAHERELIRSFNLLTQSQLRGETTEDRVARQLTKDDQSENMAALGPLNNQAVVHKITRLDRKKLLKVADSCDVKASDVANTKADNSIFDIKQRIQINEFNHQDD
jgi:hypothetical protein